MRHHTSLGSSRSCPTRPYRKALPLTTPSPPDHHGNCMLGLRLRPKTRPSLLDLIARHHLDPQLPQSLCEPSLDEDEPAPAILNTASPDTTRSKPRAASTPAATAPFPSARAMAPSRKDQEADEDHYGAVFSVSGPVIVAENMIGCAMYELVRSTAPLCLRILF
jgi:hypothetical protein